MLGGNELVGWRSDGEWYICPEISMRVSKRETEGGEVQVGLGSGSWVLDADASGNLANPSRAHFAYLPFRTAGTSLPDGPLASYPAIPEGKTVVCPPELIAGATRWQ